MSMQDIGQGIYRARHTQDRAYSGQGLLRTHDMANTRKGIIRTGHKYAGHRTGHNQDRS